MDSHCMELAQPGPSIRLCLDLEKKFPDLGGIQLDLLECLCLLACNSHVENHYLGVCGDSWLRTTITLNPANDAHHVLSADNSKYCREMVRMIMNLLGGNHVRGSEDSGSRHSNFFQFQTNILPGGAYLERLKELECQSWWENVQNMLMGTYCCMRGFYPTSILSQACERQVTLMEEVGAWRRKGRFKCNLAMHLQNRHGLPDSRSRGAPFPLRFSAQAADLEAPVSSLVLWDDASPSSTADQTSRRAVIREIPREEVEVVVENLGKGVEGSVSKVSWHKSMYAMKSFEFPGSFKREYDVAVRVSHPHIVTAFGCCSFDRDNSESNSAGRCLLMEVMAEDLFRFAVRNDTTSEIIRPPFSRVDSLDVLLQVGMAMDYMHNQDVVHGDLKPHNILISHFELSGNLRYFLAKLTDFGSAILPGEPLRKGIGSLSYSAPELLNSRGEIRSDVEYPKKLDVYSVGAVAYEILTGYPAGEEFNIRGIREGVLKMSDYKRWKTLIQKRRYPLELINLVETCWEWAPEKRPAFNEICEELKRCKAMVQSWEKRSAAIWNFVAVCLFAIVCNFILLSMRFV